MNYFENCKICGKLITKVEDNYIVEDKTSLELKYVCVCACCYNAALKPSKQHEAEIRKLLEDDIKRLKFENKNIQNAIKLVDEAKYTAQQDDIDFFVKQERQKVIAELEEWVEKNFTVNITYHEKDDENEEYKTINYLELKQKLNEMKEV